MTKYRQTSQWGIQYDCLLFHWNLKNNLIILDGGITISTDWNVWYLVFRTRISVWCFYIKWQLDRGGWKIISGCLQSRGKRSRLSLTIENNKELFYLKNRNKRWHLPPKWIVMNDISVVWEKLIVSFDQYISSDQMK